jgi:glycosyltransferase involved in cell wall biosynthesis
VRLLFINEKLGYAGTSTYALDLATALREQGDEVRVCTLGGDLRRGFVEAGIETYVARYNPLSFFKLLQFLRDYRPDLVHIQNLRSAPFGRRIAKRLKMSYVVTVHRAPSGPVPRLADPKLVGIIAVNEVIRQALVNNYGVPKSLIRVIHRGVDTDVLSAPGESPRALAGTETAARWIPVVGSIGSLTRVKGHHIFIRAARRALDLGAEALFAIVGEGEEEPALRRLVKELGLQYQVTFSPHIPSRRQLYGTFDMIVVPTLRGGVGSTALEAMSMGRPVIASAVGEILHVIQDGKNGVLVPEGDVEALAQAIVDLISRPEYRAALGQAARANVVESFSLDPMVKATREFYEEILGRLEEPGLELAGAATSP